MNYHKDLPQSWIQIIESDEILKNIWAENHSEYEAVPEFLFGMLWDELYRLKPIFALYGDAGMDMYEKISEINLLMRFLSDEVSESEVSECFGYTYQKGIGNKELAEQIIKDYIKSINSVYENIFEENSILEESATISFVPNSEKNSVLEELHDTYYELTDCDIHEDIGDWFIFEIPLKEGCEELKNLVWESLYNLEEDYNLAYYILWSLADIPDIENPFLPYYKLWCMEFSARFVSSDKILVL